MKIKGFLRITILAFSVLAVLTNFGEATQGSYGWAKRMGGSTGDMSYCITTDASGHVYITGGFSGTVNFGQDFGTTDTKTSAADKRERLGYRNKCRFFR